MKKFRGVGTEQDAWFNERGIDDEAVGGLLPGGFLYNFGKFGAMGTEDLIQNGNLDNTTAAFQGDLDRWGGNLMNQDKKALGWDYDHKADKLSRDARQSYQDFLNKGGPALSEYGDLSLEEYAALDELANYRPELGEAFTVDNVAQASAYGYDPTFADFERVGTVNLGDTELAGLNLDPATRDAQMAALGQLSGMTTDGMTGAEKARLDLINAQAGRQAKGARDALSQEMARRGISGSGLELMGKQMANQSAAEAMRLQGLEAQAMAQNRQLQALSQMSNLATGIRGQDYGIASDRARAQDAINAWNAANTQGVMGQNAAAYNQNQATNAGIANNAASFKAGAQNSASQWNAGALNQNNQFNAGQRQGASFQNAGIQNNADQWRIGQQQGIQNANTDIRNQNTQWNTVGKVAANNDVRQGNFDNQFKVADQIYKNDEREAQDLREKAKRRRGTAGDMIGGIFEGAGTFFG